MTEEDLGGRRRGKRMQNQAEDSISGLPDHETTGEIKLLISHDGDNYGVLWCLRNHKKTRVWWL